MVSMQRDKSNLNIFLCLFLILITSLMVVALIGCGSSSDTKTAVKQAQTLDPVSTTLAARITLPASNISINEGDAISFSGSATGGTESYSYAWDIPGGSTRSSAAENVESVTFSDSGKYEVTFTVTDSKGRTVSDSVTISVAAGASLTSTITSPVSNITINAGDIVSFSGQATGGSGTYNYAWDFPGGDIRSSTSQNPGLVTFSTGGTYTITFKVTDSDNNTDSSSVNITVSTVSTTLEAKITSPAGNLTTTKNTNVFLASSATGGTGTYTYKWDIPGGSSRTASTQDVTVTFANEGSYQVTLTVTDSAGDTSIEQVTITITSAQITASITSPGGDTTIANGSSLTLSGTASGGTGTYTYSWDIPQGSPNSSSSQSQAVTFNNNGTFVVTFTATDSAGDSGTDTVTITVE